MSFADDLRAAVDDFNRESMSLSSIDRFRDRVLAVADRIERADRVMADIGATVADLHSVRVPEPRRSVR